MSNFGHTHKHFNRIRIYVGNIPPGSCRVDSNAPVEYEYLMVCKIAEMQMADINR